MIIVIKMYLLFSKIKKKLKVNYTSVKVEEFLVDNPNFQQLSDHFGMSCEIHYTG